MKDHTTGPGFALSLLLFIAGCASLVMLVGGFLVPDWRANNRYVPGSCVVLDKRLADSIGKFPGASGGEKISYHPEIKIRYEVDGRNYEVWTYDAIPMFYPDRAKMQAIVDGFQVGGTYPCWFDPDSPQKAILVRGHAWAPFILLVVPVVFLTVGIVGLRRAKENRGKTAQQLALERALGPDADTLAIDAHRPNVPVLKLSGSSGSTLRT